MSLPLIQKWPYTNGPEFMTPDVVWSSYMQEHRMRLFTEIQLNYCATRIHNQREEIKRLQKLLKDSGIGSV